MPELGRLNMEFPPEHFFQTATQRMRQAHYAYEEGASYALAIYVVAWLSSACSVPLKDAEINI